MIVHYTILIMEWTISRRILQNIDYQLFSKS